MMNRWRIGDYRPCSTFLVALFLFLNHRSGSIVGHICNYRNIWFYAFCYHLRSAKPYFFLNRIGNIKPKRQFFLVFFQHTSHLCNHETSHSIIQCSTNKISVIQLKELIWVSNHTAYMDTQLFYLLLGSRTTVNENIVQFRCWFVLIGSRMNSRPAKDSLHYAFFTMNINHFRWCDDLV